MDRAAKILLVLLIAFVLWLGYQGGENADRARIDRVVGATLDGLVKTV